MRKHLMGLAVTVAAASLAPAHAASFINGSFEDPSIGALPYQQFDSPSTGITGWSVDTGSVDLVSTSFLTGYDGAQFLDLVGSGPTVGSISQTFDTIAGQNYHFSFAYNHNSASTSSASADFDFGGTTGSFTHSTADGGWLLYTGSFQASGPTSTISFVNTAGGGNGGVLLDAVTVAAVPEPATWALMIIGFAATGAMLRTRRRQGGALVAA